VKEARARQSEIRFPKCVLELSRFFRVIGFAADHSRKRGRFARRSFRMQDSFEVLRICHAELSLRPRDVRSALCRIDASRFVSSEFYVGRRDRNVVIWFCNTCLTHGHVRSSCRTSFHFSRVQSGFPNRAVSFQLEKCARRRSGCPLEKSRAICGIVCGAPREAFSSSVLPIDVSPISRGEADDDVEQLQLAAQNDVGSFPSNFRKRSSSIFFGKQRGSKPPSEGLLHLRRSAAHFWRAPRPGF